MRERDRTARAQILPLPRRLADPCESRNPGEAPRREDHPGTESSWLQSSGAAADVPDSYKSSSRDRASSSRAQLLTGNVEANPTVRAAAVGGFEPLPPRIVRKRFNVKRMRASTTGMPIYDPMT